MTNLRLLFIIITTAAIVSCATTGGVPKAVDADSGGIGTLLSFRDAALPFVSDRPHKFFLVKVDESGDLFNQNTLITSNYFHGAFLYALNLEPGKYAAVAGQFTNIVQIDNETEKTEKIVFFDKDIIQASVVNVEPGRITFMGDFDIQSHTRYYEDPDEAQEHYMALLTREVQLLGSLVKNKNDEKRTKWFLKFASRHLEKGGWSDGIEKQLAVFK